METGVKRIKLQDYIENPCKISSLPYWKTKTITIPNGMLILHDEQYIPDEFDAYTDERFFRLKHDLNNISRPSLLQGYSLVCATAKEYADHINVCYSDISVTEEYLISYTEHPVYSKDLWIAVMDENTNQIVASGIAELDPEVHEGMLEWVQVTKEYRGKGLGQFVVNELLCRMKGRVHFVTVSGKVDNVTKPEKVYRKCVFAGTDVWHILREK